MTGERIGERASAGDRAKAASLLALRVTMGFLMIWWGLNKVLTASTAVSDTFYGGMFSVGILQQGFGVLQVGLGVLLVLGLFRTLTLPVLTLMTAFTAAAVWYAIIDPFNWYLGNERPFPFTQLFYPSAIIVAAALVLMAFRDQDRLALDRRVGRR